MNPIFDLFMGNSMPSVPQNANPLANLSNTMNMFNKFRQGFSGDPRQQVMQLMSGGQMSQEQFRRLDQMARQIQKMMPK